jgi:uncharacterized lipoprotein YmbA
VLTPHAFETGERGEAPAIGIRPVVLPKYVDRLNIVTTAGPRRLLLDEQNLWAEPLDENVTRVLAENLSALLATDRVHFHPWPHGAVDYQIDVNVVRLTGTLGGESDLQALWTVHAEKGEKLVATRRTVLRRPAGDDYEAFVAALSDSLADLSREIAESIPRESEAAR